MPIHARTFQSFGTGLCDFLTGTARELCLFGSNVIPTGADPQGITSCPAGWIKDPVTGTCRRERDRLDTGLFPDFRTDNITSPAELGASMHANGHRDHIPGIRDVRRRECNRGSVLGKDGWCHPKGSITNRNRAWPKPPRPLGTRAELKAVRVAGSFANRLKRNKKTLAKTARILSSATKGGR